MKPIHSRKSARHLGCIALLFLLIVSFTPLTAQITLRGVVTDSITGEPLVGASVYVTKHRSIGTRADLDGKFSLTLPRDIAFVS
ncbi:MAG: carboxypeptidase-like regulatory domain-containing protein [Porphyromonas endodontalis]